MSSHTDLVISRLAESCVDRMGDVFWDYTAARDAAMGFAEPEAVAKREVASALHELADLVGANDVYPNVLREEYRTLVDELGDQPDVDRVVAALMEIDWSQRGARAVHELARGYGTSVLRSALALAEAMQIEDGDHGL